VRISIFTIDDKGTANRGDDVAIPGATYAIVADDGDGVYEAQKDGPVMVQISSPSGVSVLNGLPQRQYWVVETVAPAGYDLSAAVPYSPMVPTNAAQNCFDAGNVTCYADPGGGGMASVFFVNTPSTPASTTSDYESPAVLLVTILGVIIIGGALGSMVLRR
jgi:hypothetical protein